MDPKTRYEMERSRNRQQRINAILDAAEAVFASKGLERTTMQDIARQANLGIATLFRFFPKKDLLILAVSARELESLLGVFRAVAAEPISAYAKLGRLFDHFVRLLHPDRLAHVKIMENFDHYATHFSEPMEGMERFTKVWKEVSLTFRSVIRQGEADGSIRADIDIHGAMITAMNAYATFARKLSLMKHIMLFEQDLPPDRQLLQLKEMLLAYLKP
jgi:AcrR family transcriptional regulator